MPEPLGHETPLAVSLRPAARSDLDAVAAIEREAFSDPWSRASFVALLGNPSVFFLVAELPDEEGDRALAGYIVAWFMGHEAEIANVAVASWARGRGVGARLLDAALEAGAERGVTDTFLEVRSSNATARALYTARDFVLVGRRRHYYRNPVEDALIMRRTGGRRSGHSG